MTAGGGWLFFRPVPITEIRIEGLRTIEQARLTLDGLTVLIGENGSGKSSLIEACEILRRATGERFLDELYGIHGGLTALMRQGAPRLSLGVTVRPVRGEVPGDDVVDDIVYSHFDLLHYELSLVPDPAFASIEEKLDASPAKKWAKLYIHQRGAPGRISKPDASIRPQANIFWRRGLKNEALAFSNERYEHTLDAQIPYLAQINYRAISDLDRAAAQLIGLHLKHIQVHLPFEVMPAWAARALDRKSALRASSLLAPATHLEKLGLNLANAYHVLKNSFGPEEWRRTVDYIRLGLGERVEDVTTWADPGGGNIGLALKEAGLDRPIPAAQLSDGVLTYLAFVALFRLRAQRPSLLALDEPDLHLHPRLLMRVLDMLESMAAEHPVLVATHSDRLLDGLSDPARAAVLCELDPQGRTRLLRPDAAALTRWLERYRGLGEIRGAGHEASIFTRSEPAG